MKRIKATSNLLIGRHILVHDNGKHIFFDKQHELITNTDVFNEHVFVILSQDSKIEHKLPDAQ